MSVMTKCSIGLAAALGAVVAFTVPATATHQAFQHSNNCVAQNVMIDFSEDDIGRLIDLVYEECGNTAETTLGNSLYRRVSNYPNPNAAFVSGGNARRDMVVFDTQFRNSGPGNNPCKIGNAGGGPVDHVTVSPGCIKKQIGVDFDPPVTLEADLKLSNTSAITITDRTGAGMGDFPEGELVDAGPGLGGFECVMLVKFGTPKLADIICDTQMWYENDAGQVVYGLRDYNFGQPVNRALVFWLMGSNPTASIPITTAFCNAANANGALPERDFPSLALTEDPADYALTSALREEWSMGASTAYIRVFGENPSALNLVSCLGTAINCDVSELPPDPTLVPPRLSGNACTDAPGTSAPADVRLINTVPNNPTYSLGGATGSDTKSGISCPSGWPC